MESLEGQRTVVRSDSSGVLGGGTQGGQEGDGRADLQVRLAGAERAVMGDPVSYEIRIRNGGPDPAKDVAYRFHLPDGARFVSATGGGERDGPGIRFPKLERLGKGEAVFDTVTVRYPDPGRYVARATVEGRTHDPDRSNNEDAEPTTVSPPFKADLQVTKSGPATARAGDEVRFLITTTNLGPDLADWVDVMDHLPDGAEFVRANRQHVVEGRTVRWEMIHEIHAGDSVQDTVWLVFPEPGEYVNRAEVDQLTEDPRSDNDRASATITIGDGGGTGGGEGADLEMRMVGRERATVGETVSYELRVRNLGPGPARAVRIHHTVPEGGTFVRATGGGTLGSDGVVDFPVRTRLDAGGQVFDTVFVRYDQTGRFVNRAVVNSDTDDPDPSNNEDDEPTTVGDVPVADLQVVKTGPDTAAVGETVTYLITTTNLGPDLADWVYVEDLLPEGAEFVDANRSFTLDGRTVRWEMIHIIDPGESVQDTIRVVYDRPGEYVNTAAVSELTDDPTARNDTSHVRTVVVTGGGGGGDADVEIILSGPDTVALSDAAEVEYGVQVRNRGPRQAEGVAYRYRVPDGASFVDASDGGRLDDDGWVRWPAVAELAVDASRAATVTIRYGTTGDFRSRAVVETESRDGNPANNAKTKVTTVIRPVVQEADLVVSKTGPESAAPGDTVTYVITTTNGGPSAAENVVVTDLIPEGAVFVSASRDPVLSGSSVVWGAIDRLEPHAEVQDTVRLAFPVAGAYADTAVVTSDTPDPDAGNNTAGATTMVGGDVDLALQQTVSPQMVNVGESALFTLSVANVGTDSTVGPTTVTSVLPLQVEFDGASGSAWTFDFDTVTRTLIATLGTPLAPGTGAFYTVGVVARTAGQAVHPAAVSTTGDANAANDTATASLSIGDPQPLLLNKRALNTDLEIGDPVTYVLEVANPAAVPYTDVIVSDQPAPGFRFRKGTVTLDGRAIGDPVVTTDSLIFAVGRVEPGEERTLTYRMVVGANAPVGPATNTATAVDRATGRTSLPATAVVNVRDQGVFTEEGMILGRVWAEIDSVPLGIPGVRVYLQDGASAITDREGNYSFIGLRPRLWVVRVDQSTLPPAVHLKPVSSRNAGQGSSAFADLVRGEMHRVDFGAYETEEDSLWYLARDEVERRREWAAELEAERGGGIAWPLFNGWMRDSSETGPVTALPSAFGDILPAGSINGGNSNLGPRPADPVSAGLLERAANRGAARGRDRTTACWESESQFCLSLDDETPPVARGDRTVVLQVATGDSAAHVVTLEATRGRWVTADGDPVAPGLQVSVRRQTRVELRAPPGAGDGRVRATWAGREVEIEIPWTGDGQRPFLVTGLIEGQFDGRSLETAELVAGRGRDRLQDPLEEWAFESDDGRYQGGFRVAGFATGDVNDETSLTLRFDSEQDPNRRFFDDIRPEDFYGVYGDASVKSFGAQSRGRVFGALERGRSFLMYGDFLTGVGRGEATTLGRYSRTLNGVAQHYEGGMGAVELRVDGFASYDRTNQIVDELPGLGISGPYALSRGDGLIHSEQVEILVRDRSQPSLILRREVLTRFLDYSVEPFTGRLLFKRPVPSLDDQLNPVSIRVSYEVEDAAADRFWVYGVNGAVQALDRLELGGSLVRDENESLGLDLSSGNATLAVTERTFLFAEMASSDSAGVSGDAARLELRHGSDRVDARAYFVETDSTFANPSAGFGRGRREMGVRGRADLTPGVQLLGEAIRSESLITGGEREGAQIGVRFGRRWSGELGYRYAEDTAPGGNSAGEAAAQDLSSLRARVTAPLPDAARGAVFAEYEQDLDEGDQRRLLVGGDVRLFDRARLYGRHELISSFTGPYGLNPFQEQNNTVFGIAADYREGAQVFSEYRGASAFDGREAQAAMGLRNRWSVAEGLRIDTSLERLSPVGAGGDDALAVTGAVAYTAKPNWKGTLRGEYRAAGDEDHILGSVGYVGNHFDDITLLGHGVFSHVLDGPTYERSRLGLAYRSLETNNWNGLFRYEHKYESRPLGGGAGTEGIPSLDGEGASRSTAAGPLEDWDWSRTAHVVSGHVNYRAGEFTFSGQYGAKVVEEDVGDEGGDHEEASLVGARIIYDLGARFDLGLTGWALRTGSLLPAGGSFGLGEEIESPENRYAFGAELGWSPAAGFRIAGGYNAFGFIEDDFLPDQPTDQGFYVRVGYKIDRLWGDAPVVVPPPADVRVTKSGPDRVVIGQEAEYVLLPRNDGPARAQDAEIRDVLPPGAEVVDASEGYELLGDTLRWELGPFEPGDGEPHIVQLTYPDSGMAVNEACASSRSPDPRTDDCVSVATRVAPYDLRIVKSAQEFGAVQEVIDYRVTVTNLGPLPAENVVLLDSLPVGGVFVDSLDADGDGVLEPASGTYADGVISWTLPTLAAGDSVSFDVGLRYPLAGRYRNVVTSDTLSEPARAVHEIEIELPAEVELTFFAPERALRGDTVLYSLQVANRGPGTARNVRPQVFLPGATRVLSIGQGGEEFLDRVTWTLGPLEAGQDRVLEFAAAHDSLGLMRTEARVFSDFDEVRPTDRAVASVEVVDWALEVELDALPADSTGVVEYHVHVRNLGDATVDFVVVEDSIASGGTVVYVGRRGVVERDLVRWPALDSLAGRGEHVDTVRVRYTTPGLYRNKAIASAGETRADDVLETVVGLVADVRIDQFGPLLTFVGDTVEFALSVANLGPGDARDVRVTDILPTGASVVSVSPGGVQTGDTLTWELGDLAAGRDVLLTVAAEFPGAGIYVNQASVRSLADHRTGNDRADLALRVDDRGEGGFPPLPGPLGPGRRHPLDLMLDLFAPTVATVDRTTEIGLSLGNHGLEPATAAEVTVELPPGLEVDSVGTGGILGDGRIRWALGDLIEGTDRYLSFFVTFPAQDSYEVTAVLTGEGSAGTRTAADTTVTHAVRYSPAVSVDGPSHVAEGETVTYLITTTAEGSGGPFPIVLEDSLPPGATFLGASRGGVHQGDVVRWPTLVPPAAGEPIVDTLQVSYAERGVYENRVTVSPRFPGARDHVRTVVGLPADIRSDVFGPGLVLVGDSALYSVHVPNLGNGSARAVGVTLQLASGTRVLSASDGGLIEADRIVWPVLETLEAGDEFLPTVWVAYDAPGIYRHAVQVRSEFDPVGSNSDSEIVTVALTRLLAVDLGGPSEADADEVVTFTVETSYRGVEPLDSGFVQVSLPDGAIVDLVLGEGAQQGRFVRWPLEALDSGGSATRSLRVRFDRGGEYALAALARSGSLQAVDSALIAVRPVGEPVPDVIHFDFDTDSLTVQSRADLTQIAQQIREIDPATKIVLVGHADPRGSDAYNLALGRRRAESAARFLDSLGVRVQRLTTDSRGESERLSTEDTEEAWARDRRVEFHYCDPNDPAATRRPQCRSVLPGTSGAPAPGRSAQGNPRPAARDGPHHDRIATPVRTTQKR